MLFVPPSSPRLVVTPARAGTCIEFGSVALHPKEMGTPRIPDSVHQFHDFVPHFLESRVRNIQYVYGLTNHTFLVYDFSPGDATDSSYW